MARLQFYTDHLGMFRILNYKPANRQNRKASPHYREIKILDALRMKYLMDFIVAGQSDGSVKANLDLKKAEKFFQKEMSGFA